MRPSRLRPAKDNRTPEQAPGPRYSIACLLRFKFEDAKDDEACNKLIIKASLVAEKVLPPNQSVNVAVKIALANFPLVIAWPDPFK